MQSWRLTAICINAFTISTAFYNFPKLSSMSIFSVWFSRLPNFFHYLLFAIFVHRLSSTRVCSAFVSHLIKKLLTYLLALFSATVNVSAITHKRLKAAVSSARRCLVSFRRPDSATDAWWWTGILAASAQVSVMIQTVLK